MSGPLDQEARDAAATEFTANVVVVAGAGSGKTTLLVQRLLNLVLGRGVSLSSIVALTFTEKAAAEMRERLATQLSRALEILDGSSAMGSDPASWSIEWVTLSSELGGAGVSQALARDRALAAMSELDGGALGTIHAYCADLLRRHPQEAHIDPAFVVDDGSRLAAALDEEWTRFEAETLALGSPQEADWREILKRFDVSIVRDAAKAFVGKGVSEASAGESRAVETLRPGVAFLREALSRVGEQATNKRAHLWAGILGECLAAWEQSGGSALRKRLERNDLPTKAVPDPGKGSTDPDAATHALKSGERLVKSLARVDADCTEALVRLALDLAARVRERLAQEGVATFQGLLVGARDLLLRETGARRAEQERVKAVLLDEFQDTDPLQYEIAFLLGEDPATPLPSGGDAWSVRLLPGLLFIVGDPKQSIYRFRGADMASYDRAVRMLADQGARVLSLVANFRSRTEVLAPINDLCVQLIQEDPPYQPVYESLHAARGDADAGEQRVEIWTVDVDGSGAGAERRRLAEARAIGQWLFERRAVGELASYGDAALLFRSMKSVAIYQRGLAEQGVPFVTQGGKGFVEREEVVQAVALLRALVRPNDAASLVAVLRSPSCGASDVELRRFAALAHGRWSTRAASRLSAEERAQVPRVARALDGLARLADIVRFAPADEAIRRVLTEDHATWSPHLVAIHAASHSGAQRLANLEKLVTRAEQLVRAEGLSLPRVVERLWTEMEEGSDQGESPLADEAVDAARIMSIHQCKGLEFPVVFVPDLARRPGGGGVKRAAVSVDARDGMIALDLGGQVKNHASLVVARENELHEDAESARLLYVALTRAKEWLILVNADRNPPANAWPMGPIRSIWGYEPPADNPGQHLQQHVLHRVIAEPQETREAEHAAPLTALVDAVQAQDAAALRLGAAGLSRARSATGLKETTNAALDAQEFSESSAGVALAAERGEALSEDASVRAPIRRGRSAEIARAVGIAVHHALEVGALEELSAGDGRSLKAWDTLARRAAMLGAAESGAESRDVEAETLRLLRALPGSQLAQALKGARVLARELPFLLELDGVAWQGFIDLVIEKDGEIIVVDWKTDRAHDASLHRAQLTLYAEAVRRWRGLTKAPRMALAWIDGALLELL